MKNILEPYSWSRSAVGAWVGTVVPAAGVVAVLALVLNVVLSLHVWIPRDSLAWALVPVLETVVLLWLIVAVARLPAGRRRRSLLACGAVLFAIMAVFSAAEALFQYIYGRGFVAAADIPMVRGGLLLLFGEIGSLVDLLTPIAIALIVALAGMLGVITVAGGARVLQRVSAPVAGVAVFTVPALFSVFVSLPAFGTLQIASVELVRSLRPAAAYEFMAVAESGETESGEAESAEAERTEAEQWSGERGVDDDAVRYELPGIRDRDIYVFVIEAYGKAAFSRDTLYQDLEPSYDTLVEVLEREGYHLKSHLFESPVAGGFSWLAEATLLTGQNIDVEPKFEALLESGAGSLPRMLHANDYYTMMVRPGTVHGSWPEGWEFYRFEDSLVAYDGDFAYRGPGFSFVPITDQFAIWTAHQRLEEVRSGDAVDRPLYVHYQLVSSHTPFNRIPPFIENWDELGDGSIYHERSEEILRFDNTWGGGRELDEGYVASLEYVFRSITDYLDQFMDHRDDPILIFFGDHQPQRPIREGAATLAVPIHIATREPELLEPFGEYGFTPGFKPQQERPHPHFTEFYPMFAEIARRGRTVERPR